MTETEVKQCAYLMSTLWSNYKPPQDELAMTVMCNTWMQFFAKVPAGKVQRVLYEISAEGGDFAPNVGQIYARIKEQNKELAAHNEFASVFQQNVEGFAKIVGIEPPEPHEDRYAWFKRNANIARKGNL